ncbi:centromere-associated protein E-like isoform X2 [Plodia interpunctella]|uniref:centromere-associated protein E-like isoform X2 n=1 Tax=Plodia interpunctella TaxID=58824 RepID=UPI0023678852|nr:centromere-associated protein E-like isoform X2 [Plodia interpunctella]
MLADDDDEEATAGAVRYPVMPSLVSLQQMRNRLHMGHLGRKLMKWTSIATGTELRRISAELLTLYDTFAEDMREAFIMLARCRYFFPDLNKMVIEDIQSWASVTVASHTKTITGVRIIEYFIVETDTAYDYLGLGQGGEMIEETKRFWIQLLKLMIKMAELRTSFALVEAVHKAATKRLNVINKLVIPKTTITMKYIILELEEIAREELHRIKKVQQFKKKKRDKLKEKEKEKGVSEKNCPICDQPLTEKHDVDKLEEEEEKVQRVIIEEPRPPEKVVEKISEPISIPLPTPSPQPIECPHMTQQSYIDKPSELIAVHEPLLESRKDLYKPICCVDTKPCSKTEETPFHLSLGDVGSESKLQQLKKMLNDTITLGEDVANTDTGALNMNDVLKLCKDAKLRLDLFAKTEKIPETNSKLATDFEHLKSHIREVIEITRELRNITFLSPSIENFIQNCENVDEKINVAIKNLGTAPLDQNARSNFVKLTKEIDDIMQCIAGYKEEGLLKGSVDDFSKVCNVTKSKLECYAKEVNPKNQKLDHLKSHISKLESITTAIKRDGVRTASIENFLSSCKDFKMKLEQQKTEKTCDHKCDHVTRLIDQINDAVKSTKEAKEQGLISESVENFIKSCETFKSRLGSKTVESSEGQKSVQKLRSDIQGVIQLIENLQEQGLISVSIADFLRTCEDTKNKLDFKENDPLCSEGNLILSPTCNELCMCRSDESQELCEKCKEILDEEKCIIESDVEELDTSLPSPSCNTCGEGGLIDFKEICIGNNVKDKPCDGYLELEETECTDCTDCGECADTPADEDIAGNLGLFEKKVRTITKITRYRTETGDIREEREVTTIKKVKHDPDETNIDHDDFSCDSYDVGVCLTPNQNQMGFRNMSKRSKSEQMLRVSSLNSPRFKQSISFNPQVLFVRNPSQILFLADPQEPESTTSLCIYPEFSL